MQTAESVRQGVPFGGTVIDEKAALENVAADEGLVAQLSEGLLNDRQIAEDQLRLRVTRRMRNCEAHRVLSGER